MWLSLFLGVPLSAWDVRMCPSHRSQACAIFVSKPTIATHQHLPSLTYVTWQRLCCWSRERCRLSTHASVSFFIYFFSLKKKSICGLEKPPAVTSARVWLWVRHWRVSHMVTRTRSGVKTACWRLKTEINLFLIRLDHSHQMLTNIKVLLLNVIEDYKKILICVLFMTVDRQTYQVHVEANKNKFSSSGKKVILCECTCTDLSVILDSCTQI